MITFNLTIQVTLNENGTPEDALEYLMKDVARRAAEQGLFTGETAADVETWNYSVSKVTEPV